MSEKTIFKKIIDKEIPAQVVYENDDFLAFLDIMPVAYGHILFIPKEEYRWIQDLPDKLISDLFIEVKKVIQGMKQALSCDYVQISVVGEEVPHVHVHLIPRYFDDTLHGWERKKYEDSDIEIYREKIRHSLADLKP